MFKINLIGWIVEWCFDMDVNDCILINVRASYVLSQKTRMYNRFADFKRLRYEIINDQYNFFSSSESSEKINNNLGLQFL